MSRGRNAETVPWYLVAPGVLAIAFLALPIAGLLIQAPWSELVPLLASEAAREALRLSLLTSLAATAVTLVLGVPLAVLMSRTRAFSGTWARALVTLPLVLPPVVGGVALLAAFGRRGWMGSWLAEVGVGLPFTTAGVVLAQTFVAMPFVVVSAESAFAGADPRAEDAAEVLGAGRGRTFREVVLPAAAPAVAAGAALAWARAVGEFGATITFAGSLPGRTRTAPLAVYGFLQGDPDAAVALGLVLVAMSLAVLVALRGRWLPALLRR
jgi:molybdate transport system permease protein